MKVKLTELVKLQNIPKGSLVVDCGGYIGEYANLMLEMGNDVILFEPLPSAFLACWGRFKDNTHITCYRYALGEKEESRVFFTQNESSSFFKDWVSEWKTIQVKTVKLSDMIRGKNVYVKINCEGAEYEIIKDLNENDILKDIPQLLIQFHKVGGDRNEAEAILSKTHEKIHDYKWTLWKKST